MGLIGRFTDSVRNGIGDAFDVADAYLSGGSKKALRVGLKQKRKQFTKRR